MGHVSTSHIRVRPQLVELARIGDLAGIEPSQQIEIDHRTRVDDQIATPVPDIIPGEENLARLSQVVKGSSGFGGGMTCVPKIVGVGVIGWSGTVLIESCAWKIPC